MPKNGELRDSNLIPPQYRPNALTTVPSHKAPITIDSFIMNRRQSTKEQRKLYFQIEILKKN